MAEENLVKKALISQGVGFLTITNYLPLIKPQPLFTDITQLQTRGTLRCDELAKLYQGCGQEVKELIIICLLGKFRLQIGERQIYLPSASKSETLLAHLGLQAGGLVSRERLIEAIWPDSDLLHGRRSLNTLIHNLNKLLAPALQGASAVLYENDYYRLNIEAGIIVDVICFESLIAK